MRRKETDRWADQPPEYSERTAPDFPQRRQHARTPPGERSTAASRRTSVVRTGVGHQPGAERLALPGDKASAEGGSAAWATKAQRRANRPQTPLLERFAPLSAQAAGLWPAPSGQHPEESGTSIGLGPDLRHRRGAAVLPPCDGGARAASMAARACARSPVKRACTEGIRSATMSMCRCNRVQTSIARNSGRVAPARSRRFQFKLSTATRNCPIFIACLQVRGSNPAAR